MKLQQLYKALVEARKHFHNLKRANSQGAEMAQAVRAVAIASRAYASAFRKACKIN